MLRPNAAGMMISTQGLATPFRNASSRWTKWACWFLALTAIAGYVSVPWLVASFAGHVETGLFVDFDSCSVRTKTGHGQITTIRYTVGPDRTEHVDDVDSMVASRVYVAGTPLPVRVSPGAVHVGTTAGLDTMDALLNTIVLLIASLFATGMMAGGAAWYDQKKLVEGRSGKLREDFR